MKGEKLDLFSHLVDADAAGAIRSAMSQRSLMLDSELAIIAGTDTTSTTLASSIYLLALHPDKLQLLREDIDECFTSINDFAYESISKKTYVNGIINEALRLFPPVPAGMQRQTPPEGIMVNGTHIPGNVSVTCPTWVIHRGKHPGKISQVRADI